MAFSWKQGNASIYFTSAGVTIAFEDGQSRWALKTRFEGAREVDPTGISRQSAVLSYFTGSPDEWVTGVRTFSGIAYRDLWPGIDLVYLAHKGNIKYEFRVDAGADPSVIQLSYEGATSIRLTDTGALGVRTPIGSLVEKPPVSFQAMDGLTRPVASRYRLLGNRLGFDLGPYNPTKPLVIDPVVVLQSGYLGGADLDAAYGIDIDGSGNAYLTGLTRSSEATFPATAGPDVTYNDTESGDAFVAKLSPAGTFAYVGYIGGTAADAGSDVVVDTSGAAYVVGNTQSSQSSFPVLGGPDLTANGGVDGFVAKVSPSGTSLSYSGYIGGAGFDAGYGIDVDGSGRAFVAGETESTEATFPEAVGPDLTYNGEGDAFIAKVAANGTGLSFAGYVGGSEWDFGNAIAVDSSGNAYVAGSASSSELTFPEVGGPDLTHNGGGDAFLAKVAASGASLNYAGYVGGSAWDAAWGVAVDSSGNAYLSGDTDSDETTFPVTNGPDLTYNGASDAFAARITPTGAGLSYAGYLGGNGNDYAGYTSVAVDNKGNAYLTGTTNSPASSFPATTGPDLTQNGANDAYVARLTSTGSIDYAGYIGGSQYDSGYAIEVDAGHVAYVAGATNSTEATFPVAGGPDQTFNDMGIGDAFVTKVGVFHPLLVSKAGSGAGTVTSAPAGIECGGDCEEDFQEGASVTLTASAGPDSRFSGWSGACSGTSLTCQLAVDGPKNVTASFIETIPPDTSIVSGPAQLTNQTSAQFAFTSNEAGSTFSCSIDGGAFQPCSSPKAYSSLSEGSHEFRVRAIDPSGNVDASPASRSWNIDLTPPQTTITSGPTGLVKTAEATFTFSSSDSPPVLSCALDTGAFSLCSSPKSYSALPDGTHTFSVRAEDQAGNIDPSPATRSWVVDAKGPVLTFLRPTSGLYVNDQSFGGQGPTVVVGPVTVEVRAIDGESGVSTFRFEVNGAAVDPAKVTSQNGVYRFSFEPPSAGQYTITAKATNGSGIESTSSIQIFASPS